MTTIVLTSGTSWTVPSDWNNAANTIYVLGAGADGSRGANSTTGASGGASGSYADATNVTLTPGASVQIHVGVRNGATSVSGTGATWFNGTAANAATCGARAGNSGSSSGASVPGGVSTGNSGSHLADGAASGAGGSLTAGGGGGAAPPGLGGSPGVIGGAGGVSAGGTGATNGDAGAGAGGVGATAGSAATTGGSGNNLGGGAGSGGGGAGGAPTTNQGASDGGSFGAGGGGTFGTTAALGHGVGGVIVIVYTPSGPPVNEVATAADAISEVMAATGARAEAVTATDAVSAAASLTPVITETAAGIDASSGAMASSTALNEIAPPTDTLSYTISGAVVDVERHETVIATDTLTPSAFQAKAINEATPATDAFVVGPKLLMGETVSATDGLRFTLTKYGVVQFSMITAKVGLPRGYEQIPQTGV